MRVYFSSAGLRLGGAGWFVHFVRFLDTVLRGIGQVMLQRSSLAGLVFLLGIAIASPLFALGAWVGACAGTATAQYLGASRPAIRRGLYGFNGALAGIALLYFLQPDWLTWACVVLAASGCTVLTAAIGRLLRVWRLPALTAPFVLVSWCFFLTPTRFRRLQASDSLPTAALPSSVVGEGPFGLESLVDGVLNGMAQVFFQTGAITGVLFLLGLLLCSRQMAWAALLGSVIGLAVGWMLGASEEELSAGLYGFNSVLVAVALTGQRASHRLGPGIVLFAMAITPLVYAALSAALLPLGLPALTFPFVIVTLLFTAALPAFAARGQARQGLGT